MEQTSTASSRLLLCRLIVSLVTQLCVTVRTGSTTFLPYSLIVAICADSKAFLPYRLIVTVCTDSIETLCGMCLQNRRPTTLKSRAPNAVDSSDSGALAASIEEEGTEALLSPIVESEVAPKVGSRSVGYQTIRTASPN